MARSPIVKTLAADRDLDVLFGSVASDAGLDRVEAVAGSTRHLGLVAQNPGMGRIRPELDEGPRTFSVWPWVIVYEPARTVGGFIVWYILAGDETWIAK